MTPSRRAQTARGSPKAVALGRRARPARHAVRAAHARRPARDRHRRRHRRRRRRLRPAACGASWACSRPVTCAWRSPRWPEQLAADARRPAAPPLDRLLQHRFGGTGALAGHAVGNLLLAGLMEVLDDPVTALDEVGAFVGARGRVLPMACEPLDIEAEVDGPRGRRPAPRAPHPRAGRRRVHPRSGPPGPAAPRAAAGLRPRPRGGTVRGPAAAGPRLLVHQRPATPARARATRRARVQRCPEGDRAEPGAGAGETAGFSPEQHLAVLAEHAPDLRVDAVLADTGSVPLPDRLHRAAAALLAPGGRVHLAPIAAMDPTTPRHDPLALADALRAVLASPDPARTAAGYRPGRRATPDVRAGGTARSARGGAGGGAARGDDVGGEGRAEPGSR